jgi:hypothetical protein
MFRANFCPSSGAQDLDYNIWYNILWCGMQGFPSVSVIVASRWSSIFALPTLMMHGQTQIKYVCYITILDMFRALTCPSSGGQLVLSQHLVSSLSVNGGTVCHMRADCRAKQLVKTETSLPGFQTRFLRAYCPNLLTENSAHHSLLFTHTHTCVHSSLHINLLGDYD